MTGIAQFSYRFASMLALLLLAACVHVPQNLQLLQSTETDQSCTVRESNGDELQLAAAGFTLSSWNMCKGCRQGWKGDLRQLADQSDLLLLQEAHMQEPLEQLLDASGLDWSLVHAFSLDGWPAGVLTGARVHPLAVCAQRISEPFLRVPKTAMLSYYALEGRTESLLVVNVHGVNFAPGSTDLAHQLLPLQERIARHDGPVIVAGDFNTWSRRRMAVLRQLARKNGLRAVSFEGTPSRHFGRQLDHIYYRGLIVQHAWVTALRSSDHYPLNVTFKADQEI